MINWQLEEQRALVTIRGRLDAHEANGLRACFDEAQRAGAKTFFLIMAQVDFMDSAGLASVISGLKAARLGGGELYIIAPSEPVKKVLDYTLLNRIVPIRESLEEAQVH